MVFLTVCANARRPILARSDVADLLLACWAETRFWLVGRYIIMPSHIHLFCAPAEFPSHPLKKWLQYWKSRASTAWPRRDEQPVWHTDGWDTQLRREESYAAKWEYVVANPVRAGLVERAEDWPFQGELNVLRW